MNSPNYPPKGTQAKRKADGLVGRVYVSSPKADLVAVRWTTDDGSGTFLFNAEQFAHGWEWRGTGASSLKVRAGVIAGAVVVVILGIGVFGGLRARQSALASPGPAGSLDANGDPQANSTAALEDPKALLDKYGAMAASECSKGADEYVKSITRYEFKWDDAGAGPEKFNEYETLYVAQGITTSVSDKLLLQERSGAFKRVKLLCSYDTSKKKVLKYWMAASGE